MTGHIFHRLVGVERKGKTWYQISLWNIVLSKIKQMNLSEVFITFNLFVFMMILQKKDIIYNIPQT